MPSQRSTWVSRRRFDAEKFSSAGWRQVTAESVETNCRTPVFIAARMGVA